MPMILRRFFSRHTRPVTVLLLAISTIGVFAQDDARPNSLFSNAVSEKKRLIFCIHLIEKKTIHRGMKIQRLDELFGTKYTKRLKKMTSSNETAWIDFAHTSSPWSLFFTFDDNGTIESYELSNTGSKNVKDLALSPPIEEVSKHYHSANSQYRRLLACIEAIDTGVIAPNTPISRIERVFGPQSMKKRCGDEDIAGVIRFSRNSDSWKFYYSYRDNRIIDYHLTNIEN